METSTDRTGAFYKISYNMNANYNHHTVHFVYYDIQLTKMNQQVNKEEKLGSK